MFELTRDNAWNLLTEYTKSESLRKHALAVEAAVRGYARKFGEDEEVWGVVALLHDFDYEQYPDLKDHPFRGAEILRERGCPDFVIRAILSHGEHTNTPRESQARAHALCLRRDGGVRHGRGARASVEERPGSRGRRRSSSG